MTNFIAEAAIGRIYLHEVQITNLQATVKINGPRIDVNPFKLWLNGAPASTTVALDLGVPGYKYNVAASALADLMARPTTVTLDELVMTVAQFYSISRDDLLGRGRNKELVHPRQVVMYLAREELQLTLPQIGESLGGRDHTTVIYGVEKITQAIDSDDNVRRELLSIRERLYNRSVVSQRA